MKIRSKLARIGAAATRCRMTPREFVETVMLWEPSFAGLSDADRAERLRVVADFSESTGDLAKAKQLRSYFQEFPTAQAAASITPERDELYSSMREWM